MMDKHELAKELAEEALEAALHGDQKKSEELIEESRELDPTALVEVSHAHEHDGETPASAAARTPQAVLETTPPTA